MRVLVTKVGAAPSRLAARLRTRGLAADEWQLGEIRPLAAALDLTDATHILATSRYARQALARATVAASAQVVDGVALPRTAQALREALSLTAAARVVYLKARNAPDRFAALAAVCAYRAMDIYENVEVTGLRPEGRGADYAAVFFTCASSVVRFLRQGGAVAGTAYALGEETAAALRAHGLEPVVAPRPTLEALAELAPRPARSK